MQAQSLDTKGKDSHNKETAKRKASPSPAPKAKLPSSLKSAIKEKTLRGKKVGTPKAVTLVAGKVTLAKGRETRGQPKVVTPAKTTMPKATHGKCGKSLAKVTLPPKKANLESQVKESIPSPVTLA